MPGSATPSPQPQLLREIVGAAIHAPSSHNTQPWLFRLAGGAIELYADRTRALPVNDPHDRELTLSCGAALLTLRVGAAHAGLAASVDVIPEPGDPDLLARVRLERGAPAAELAALFDAVSYRRTYRELFDHATPIPADLLDGLAAAAAAEGAWMAVLEGDAREAFIALVDEGDRALFADPSWRRELAVWLHPRRRGDGLTAPALTAPIERTLVRHVDLGKSIAGRDADLARKSEVLAVIGSDGDDAAAWLAAGQALQRALLVNAARGLQASYLNQPLQVAELRPKVQHLLRRSGFPQVAVRLGWPAGELRHTPRRPLDDVLL
ncbi:MAG TPA: hypothetical protein VII98_10865 [Solirubrobacteraceae bacterium]